ncbi:cytokine receptor [Pieris rapae]|uniref:cytokine receptor n=1 Tax=Pieris rapae TaxID=64459 RepID=UPI001E27F4B8|nr:cytokine receptor [Pieris rapae]
MAECIEFRKILKCCFRPTRGSQLRIWTLCFIILGLPSIYSACHFVGTYPPGTINVLYGQPLEIFCVAEKNYSSRDIEFSLYGKQLDSEIVNSTTIRLYIEKPEKQVNTYYCKNTKSGKNCINRVLVDSLPPNVTDFKCISNNLEILNCSWIKADTESALRYNLTFESNGNFVTPCTVQMVENSKTKYCIWNSHSFPRYREQEKVFFFVMETCNYFGCNSQNYSIDHYSIVKPDRPLNLKSVKIGTHSVLLKWNVPNTIVDFLDCGVVHKIEYQIEKIDNTTFFHEVNASSLPFKNKTYKFNLTLPYAHMKYEVRISIKSRKAPDSKEFWSDNSFLIFYTDSEPPQRPPDTCAGAFDRSVFVGNYRMLYIYWKQLEEYEQAGANFTYKVLVSQDNKTQILFPDKNKSLSYVMLNASVSSMDVTIWSFNQMGSSVNSSNLYIPSEKNIESLGLTSFTKLAYENGTYELAWGGSNEIDNYTLFWCQHNSTNICIGQMNYTVLDPTKSRYVIDLPREHRYQFAISANNGTTTSGIVWAKCDISKEGFVMYRFNMHLQYDIPGKTFVNLKWEMECVLQDGIITGYNISYCPTLRTGPNCDKSFETKHVYISNPKQTNKTIEGLLPFRTYQFSIAINTIFGQKTVENASAQLTTSEDTPTSPVNLAISDVTNNSLVISWDPPYQRNGNIGKYIVNNFNKEIYVDKVSETDKSRRIVTLTGLQAFSNYSLTVQACNIPINACSKHSLSLYVRTAIGTPSRLKAPTTIINNPDKLRWEPPEIPGGTVDRYQIKIIKDDNLPEIINTTNLSYTFTHCEGGVSTETYQVRAVNFDNDLYHGVKGDAILIARLSPDNDEYPGPWSEPSTVACRSRDGFTMIIIFMVVFALVGFGYGSIKLYKKYRKMEDIKPVLPYGLGEPEKDRSKFPYPEWNPSTKDEKPSSDEMLLLPNTKSSTVSTTDIKQKDDICAASDHTDSTALSDSSIGPVDRQISTSDDGSNSSLHIEADTDKGDENTIVQEDSSEVDSESSRENSPYFSDKTFKKNPNSGYVQPVVSTTSGYVQSAPAPLKPSQLAIYPQATTSSYVMAGLPPPLFTSRPNPVLTSGYVMPEDVQGKSIMSSPKIMSGNPKGLGPESLPTLPTLPPSVKPSTDSSYIQLQSLDSLPSLKSVRNTVPLKPPASSGYITPGDVVINKHLNNMMSAGQLPEDSAILDPTMSPDAYCRFSWSTDPANDNLHSLLTDSPTRNISKN